MSEETVGFIGLGAMGLPMATNLIAAGFTVRVWNRTASKAEPLVARGAMLATSPGEAVAPGGIAVTMLADDAAVEAVTMGDGGLAARLARGGIHLSMSTIAPATARALADYHATRGTTYIGSPVFGRPDAAEQRQLVVCTSGRRQPRPARGRFSTRSAVRCSITAMIREPRTSQSCAVTS